MADADWLFKRLMTSEILYLGGYNHHHMKMIRIAANQLDLNAGHTSQQSIQYHFKIDLDFWIQDPTAVFTDQNDIRLQPICAM